MKEYRVDLKNEKDAPLVWGFTFNNEHAANILTELINSSDEAKEGMFKATQRILE